MIYCASTGELHLFGNFEHSERPWKSFVSQGRAVEVSAKVLASANFFQEGPVAVLTVLFQWRDCSLRGTDSLFLLSFRHSCLSLIIPFALLWGCSHDLDLRLRCLWSSFAYCYHLVSLWPGRTGFGHGCGWAFCDKRPSIPCIWCDPLSSFTTFSHHFTWGVDMCVPEVSSSLITHRRGNCHNVFFWCFWPWNLRPGVDLVTK